MAEKQDKDQLVSMKTRVSILLFSLVLSVLMWITASKNDNMDKRMRVTTIEAPLLYADMPEGYVVTKISAETVSVMIEGETDLISNVEGTSPSPVRPFVSLQGLRPGSYRQPVQVETPVGVRMIDRSPQFAEFDLARVIERTMRPVVDLPSTDKERIHSISFEPAEIKIKGPDTQVLNARNAVVHVSAADLAGVASLDLPVDIIGPNETKMEGLEITPPSVVLIAKVSEPTHTVKVNVSVPTRGTPPEGYAVSAATVSPQTVTLRGTKEALANITELTLDPIDISGLEGDMTIDIPIEAPTDDIEIDVSTVRFTVSVRSVVDTVALYDLPIHVEGALASRVWSTSPTTASATVEYSVGGEESAVADAMPVELYIDVTNIVADTVTLPVLARGIGAGARVIKIDPPRVTAISVRSGDQ